MSASERARAVWDPGQKLLVQEDSGGGEFGRAGGEPALAELE